ncbi:MAG: hypothetical protein P4L66_00895 [Acetobacteraceae bacterium]|nr:hypothetical protein [Acetobacteraceae bacterium]
MRFNLYLADGLAVDLSDIVQPDIALPEIPPPQDIQEAQYGVLAGATTGVTSSVVLAGQASGAASLASAPIGATAHDVLAAKGQSVSLASLFSVGASAADPTYLILSGLDRVEYTAGYATGAMGHLVDGSVTQGFVNSNADAWSVDVVFTYQAATGQYINATYGSLSQVMFKTGTNAGDTATFSLFGTNNASVATQYAAQPMVLCANPSLVTDYGSVAIVTAANAATSPASATPGGIVSVALSFVGDAWNSEGCWVLASDISAKAGATLPLTSSMVAVAGIGNGEWFVAYNGPVSANAGWQNNLVAGEMVSFVTTSGGGHITTVVSGQGASAQLVDNITYVNANGSIADAANDGSANDVIVQAPHAASAEFNGVNAASVVVYELDCPVVTATSAAVSVVEGASVTLAADFSATNPKSGQSITQYQVYDTNAADTLTLSGVANKTAVSAATACTLTSLSGLALAAGGATGSDTVEVRAYNGSYWGDWTALTVSVTAPVPVTAAKAVATTGTGMLAVSDTAANIGAEANALQTLAAAGRLSSVAITGGGTVALTDAQLSSDHTLLALLPAKASVSVAAATVAQAAALQSNAQVAGFSITDTAADVTGKTVLGTDNKLTGITITGTTGANTLNLTGISAPVAIDLGGDTATVTGGLSAAAMNFITPPDVVTLGSGAATITAGLTGGSGIETIANFQFGLDQLQLSLGSLTALNAFNTLYNGAHAIALTGGGLTQGVVLINQPTTMTAASLLAGHVHIAGGVATIA